MRSKFDAPPDNDVEPFLPPARSPRLELEELLEAAHRTFDASLAGLGHITNRELHLEVVTRDSSLALRSLPAEDLGIGDQAMEFESAHGQLSRWAPPHPQHSAYLKCALLHHQRIPRWVVFLRRREFSDEDCQRLNAWALALETLWLRTTLVDAQRELEELRDRLMG